MIHPADSRVTFSGPRRFDQALEFVGSLPEGAAVVEGDGSIVKMKRSVVSTGGYRLATKAEVRQWAHGGIAKLRGAVTLASLVPMAAVLFAFFFSSTIASGAEKLPSGGYGFLPGAVFVAEITTGNKILDGVIGGAVTLLGYHFVFRRYIREQAGVQEEPTRMEITGQPLKMQAVRQCVEHEELNLRLEGYVTNDTLHETEHRLEQQIEGNFRELDDKRSRSIGNLHDHLKATERKLGDKISEEVLGTHERINQLAGTVGEVKGTLSQVTGQLADISRMLMNRGGKAG